MAVATITPISLHTYTANHTALTISAGIIMAVSIFYLKLCADATLFARDGRISPIFFFFGDTHTLSKYVQSIAITKIPKEGFTIDTAITSLNTRTEKLYAFAIAKMEAILNYIIIPAIGKYTTV
jgi:hypothetical protein